MNTYEPYTRCQFPPLELLKKQDGTTVDTDILKQTALKIYQILSSFGVRVVVADIIAGTSFTRYVIQPEQGVRISDITRRENEIKIGIGAKNIRIEAPIPGKAAIGIDIINDIIPIVAIRDLFESVEFRDFPSNLAFAVGRDMLGQVVVCDIATMPHLLISGTTGSGKTVCIDSIVMSILYKSDPSDVKLIMIDTKMINMSVYNGIPHLLIPVVTDARKAQAALNWCIAETHDRYRRFAYIGVNDLKGYNMAMTRDVMLDGEPLYRLPQIVVIIDDLYDLTASDFGNTQENIYQLARLSRAVGIYLVISTHRPSADVITGMIKAVMPSRIAFSVFSATDSHVILDESGAEKLLGKGDMLFKPQGYSKAVRIQGAYVSETEVLSVVDFLKNQMLGNIIHNNEIEKKIKVTQTDRSIDIDKLDAYFIEAGKLVIEQDKASIGMIQRVFKIGFNRAVRIVDQLEAAGVVGAEEGIKPRRILISMEQFQNLTECDFDANYMRQKDLI